MYKQILKTTIGICAISTIFTACGGGSGDFSSSPVDVTVVDGYVKNATVTDNSGQTATYTSNGVYRFNNSIVYPISTTGGALEDTDLAFDINMSVNDGVSTVISPITSFLGNDSTLLSKFAGLGLGISTLDEFSVDYVNTNDTNLAKLSQLLYIILKDSTLTTTFKSSVGSNSTSSLDNLFTLASTDINASTAFTAQEILRMNNLLTAVNNYDGTAANMENSINAYKSNLSTESTTVITHNDITYGTVLSPHTGKTWLDRNIGASQTCTSITDTSCYGDYFQWGREADGHENNTSTTTATQATAITNAGSLFITHATDWTTADSDRTLRAANWAATDGSSVCPTGYRVPTIDELSAETINLTGTEAISNITDLFNGFLAVPASGWRKPTTSWSNVGTGSSIATTSFGTTSTTIKTIDFDSSSASVYNTSGISIGITVRCIKN